LTGSPGFPKPTLADAAEANPKVSIAAPTEALIIFDKTLFIIFFPILFTLKRFFTVV
jgi:hypothetical protein